MKNTDGVTDVYRRGLVAVLPHPTSEVICSGRYGIDPPPPESPWRGLAVTKEKEGGSHKKIAWNNTFVKASAVVNAVH
jgi:hypothetical protein